MRRTPMIVVTTLLVLGGSPVEAGIFGFAPWSYTAEPISGRVMDQATGQPIEGAVVVAQWVLSKPPEGHTTDLWVVFEALTDAQGRYYIPGWGPKTRPWFRWLDFADPRLLVLKPGYWPEHLWNSAKDASSGGINAVGDKIRKSYWNNKDIVLWPFPLGAPISAEWKAAHRLNPYPDAEILTEVEWVDQLGLIQNAAQWSRLDDENGPLNGGARIRQLILMIQDECMRVSTKYRYRIEGIPRQHHETLLGKREPCP